MVMLIFLLDLLSLMVINITTCLQFWLKPFKIWPLQVEVKIMVMLMVMLIFLLDLLSLMEINITTCLKFWPKLFKIWPLSKQLQHLNL